MIYTTALDRVPFNEHQVRQALDLAQLSSGGSACVRRRVGAVAVDPTGIVRGFGFNHVRDRDRDDVDCTRICPRALLDHVQAPPFTGYGQVETACHAVHAEIDAFSELWSEVKPDDRGFPFRGWYVFVTCMPCDQCRAALSVQGIIAVWSDVST